LIERLRAGLSFGFEAPTVVLFDDLTADQMIVYEHVWIVALGRRNNNTGRLYNLNDGTPLDAEPQPRRRAISSEALINRELRLHNPARVSVLRRFGRPK
jgi:hypothetical protein